MIRCKGQRCPTKSCAGGPNYFGVNATRPKPTCLKLNDNIDVTIYDPEDNQYLCYTGGTWINSYITINSIYEGIDLNDLNDVEVPTPNNGDCLCYTGGTWINTPITVGSIEGGIALNNLTDVTVPAPSNGDQLAFIGGGWINRPNVLNNLNDVNISSANDCDYMVYNNSLSQWLNQPLGQVQGTNNTSGGEGAYKGVGGTDNTVWGFGSLGNLTTGNDNVAIGAMSLSQMLNGDLNTAIGFDVQVPSSCSGATIVGASSEGNTDSTVLGSRSSAIGESSISIGVNAVSNSKSSIAIGKDITADQENGFFVRHNIVNGSTGSVATFVGNQLVETGMSLDSGTYIPIITSSHVSPIPPNNPGEFTYKTRYIRIGNDVQVYFVIQCLSNDANTTGYNIEMTLPFDAQNPDLFDLMGSATVVSSGNQFTSANIVKKLNFNRAVINFTGPGAQSQSIVITGSFAYLAVSL